MAPPASFSVRMVCGTTLLARLSSAAWWRRFQAALHRRPWRARSPTSRSPVAGGTTSPSRSSPLLHDEADPMSGFTIDVYQNEYLPFDGSEVNAVLTVTSEAGNGPAHQPDAAEIVIIDTSGSMNVPRAKIKAAREATGVAIDCIRDGVAFGVISGAFDALQVYPARGELVLATDRTRTEAKRV